MNEKYKNYEVIFVFTCNDEQRHNIFLCVNLFTLDIIYSYKKSIDCYNFLPSIFTVVCNKNVCKPVSPTCHTTCIVIYLALINNEAYTVTVTTVTPRWTLCLTQVNALCQTEYPQSPDIHN